MKPLQALSILLLFSFACFAQFNSSRNPDELISMAVENARSVNAQTALQVVQRMPDLSSEQKDQQIRALHKKLFNAAARDNKREAIVTKNLTPLLTTLKVENKISLLVIDDIFIPYARLTAEGVFVMTTALAQPMDSKDKSQAYFLRELARLTVANDYAEALRIASVKSLRGIDLTITAITTKLFLALEMPTKDLEMAINWSNTKETGGLTKPTYPSDLVLFRATGAAAVRQSRSANISGGWKNIFTKPASDPEDVRFPTGTSQVERLDQHYRAHHNIPSLDDQRTVIALIKNQF